MIKKFILNNFLPIATGLILNFFPPKGKHKIVKALLIEYGLAVLLKRFRKK